MTARSRRVANPPYGCPPERPAFFSRVFSVGRSSVIRLRNGTYLPPPFSHNDYRRIGLPEGSGKHSLFRPRPGRPHSVAWVVGPPVSSVGMGSDGRGGGRSHSEFEFTPGETDDASTHVISRLLCRPADLLARALLRKRRAAGAGGSTTGRTAGRLGADLHQHGGDRVSPSRAPPEPQSVWAGRPDRVYGCAAGRAAQRPDRGVPSRWELLRLVLERTDRGPP